MTATKNTKRGSVLAFLLVLPFFLQGQQIDSRKSQAEFSVSNMGIFTVKGTIGGMHGNVAFDANDPGNASFDVCVRPKTINTGNSRRDRHLTEEDFFHVEKYPDVCIVSERITQTSEGYLLTGYLTVKDTRKRISLPFTYSNGVFTGNLTINRHDYDLGTSASGSFAIGDEVDVVIHTQWSK